MITGYRRVWGRVYWKIKKLRFVFNSFWLFCGWGFVTTSKKQKLNCQPGSDANMIAKYTKEILKNTKEKSGIRIFQFLALKTILRDIYDCWLYSWGPNASFDTHIDIYIYVKCHMTYMSDTTYMTYMTYMTCMVRCHTSNVCMSIWVSKEALGPQECSQPSKISNKIVFRAKNWNILFW